VVLVYLCYTLFLRLAIHLSTKLIQNFDQLLAVLVWNLLALLVHWVEQASIFEESAKIQVLQVVEAFG
jgi:hypothetical protein